MSRESDRTEQLRAELTVGSGLLKATFSTRNVLHRPGLIEMHLDKGPLKSLHGRWTLTPVTAGQVTGCRVDLDLTFEPHGAMAMALGPVIVLVPRRSAIVAATAKEAASTTTVPITIAIPIPVTVVVTVLVADAIARAVVTVAVVSHGCCLLVNRSRGDKAGLRTAFRSEGQASAIRREKSRYLSRSSARPNVPPA